MTGEASFTCPACGKASRHPDDVANGYCGACHAFTGRALPASGLPPGAVAWATVDKTGWPAGRWHAEPDRVQWTDQASGLPCLITRHAVKGHLRGYVAVPAGHPLHDVAQDHVSAGAPGSVTWAAAEPGDGRLDPAGIPPCDLAGPWWIGFDAGHSWDLGPGDTVMWELLGVVDGVIPGDLEPFAEYRDIAYMAAGCMLLAAQLAGLLPSLT